ncbi:HupE/UreJ family protein [Mangrovimicrobium sediminis]|uniref:HupE/UreJ family protein n=1 Tax=Mangrovimicrobium sediminis TaxID=2562682 RepID=A0A4Z0LU51_9GAMM|nr:HupE/UreJ family protein [Haliea sp. SAOS-164]TGD70943.1 HupE/UreJ family protein [Haliea sp. SAOS-164]
MHDSLRTTPYWRSLAAIVLTLGSLPAWAHVEQGVAGGLVSGLLHPVMGPDHLVAMVAVGLWGAQLGAPAIWLLPVVFPVVMALGGLFGVAGVPLPFIEFGIALSALLLGLAVAARFRANLVVMAVLVGLFAIFHGHAHGTELPQSANAMAFGVGFVISTGLLHLAGILIGLLVRWPVGSAVVRACGAGIAAIGLYYLSAASGLA